MIEKRGEFFKAYFQISNCWDKCGKILEYKMLVAKFGELPFNPLAKLVELIASE